MHYALHEISKHDMSINKIIIPSFICSELIPVFEHLKLKIEFYTINDDLTFEEDELESLLSKDKTFLLVINYFGFPANWDMIAKLRKKFDFITIEDNAHTLCSLHKNKKLGEFGDISFNSFRKMLPLLSGSELIFNKHKPNNTYIHHSRFPTIGEIIYSLRSFKTKIFKKMIHVDTKTPPTNFNENKIDFISNKILQNIDFNKNDIVNIRNRNYTFWENYLKDKNLTFFKNLKAKRGVCPYVFPCLAKSENEKNNWINWGKEKNISIISWPDLPEMAIPFLKDKNLKNMLCFPVNHQFDLTKIIS